jgi:hypothetical protein
MFFEYLNYALALAGLGLLYLLARQSRARRERTLTRYLSAPKSEGRA